MSINTNIGVVKFYNEEKGFGFIKPDDGTKDVFVHKNGVRNGQLADGAKVRFTIESAEKGLRAINVDVVN